MVAARPTCARFPAAVTAPTARLSRAGVAWVAGGAGAAPGSRFSGVAGAAERGQCRCRQRRATASAAATDTPAAGATTSAWTRLVELHLRPVESHCGVGGNGGSYILAGRRRYGGGLCGGGGGSSDSCSTAAWRRRGLVGRSTGTSNVTVTGSSAAADRRPSRTPTRSRRRQPLRPLRPRRPLRDHNDDRRDPTTTAVPSTTTSTPGDHATTTTEAPTTTFNHCAGSIRSRLHRYRPPPRRTTVPSVPTGAVRDDPSAGDTDATTHPGGDDHVARTGFAPDSDVDVTLHSAPIGASVRSLRPRRQPRGHRVHPWATALRRPSSRPAPTSRVSSATVTLALAVHATAASLRAPGAHRRRKR